MEQSENSKLQNSQSKDKNNSSEKQASSLYSYEVRKEGGEDVLYINYLGSPYVPSIADSAEIMNKSLDVLLETPNVSRIILSQPKNYNYDFQ